MTIEQNNRNVGISFGDLMDLSQSGVYILYNEDEKICQIFNSINMLSSIENNMKYWGSKEYGIMYSHLSILKMKVLEYTKNTKVAASGWISKYRNEGWKFYKETYLVQYKVRVGICDGHGIVYLENKRKDKILLGRFSSIDEATKWKKDTYPNDIVDKVVYYTPNG